MTLDLNSGDLLCCFFFLFLIIHCGCPFNKRVRFTYLGKFLARSRRVLTTDCLCFVGCSDLKLRYLSESVGLRYAAESKWPLGERLINRSKNGRHPFFLYRSEFDGAFYCVQMCQEFEQLWFLHDYKSAIYISFPQTWRV